MRLMAIYVDYASWTLHMASIIIFSTLWGFYFREWFGASPKARRLIFVGIGLLIASTIVIGAGAYIKKDDGPASPGAAASEEVDAL
jgi:L-rhamnose-H+ transport protein